MKITTLSLMLTMVSTMLTAQSFFDKLGSGINFDVDSPIGDLSDNGLTNYYGLSMELFYVGCSDKKFRFTPGYRIGGGVTRALSGEQVALTLPAGAQATEKIFNSYLNLEIVGRVIYDNNNRIRPYAEVYFGGKFTQIHELLDLNGPSEEFRNTSEVLFSDASSTKGLGLGALIQLSDALDLNVKTTLEHTKSISHSDLSPTATYSREEITTANSLQANFSVGLTFRPRCGRERNINRNDRRARNNSHRSCRRGYSSPRPQAIQRIRT